MKKNNTSFASFPNDADGPSIKDGWHMKEIISKAITSNTLVDSESGLYFGTPTKQSCRTTLRHKLWKILRGGKREIRVKKFFAGQKMLTTHCEDGEYVGILYNNLPINYRFIKHAIKNLWYKRITIKQAISIFLPTVFGVLIEDGQFPTGGGISRLSTIATTSVNFEKFLKINTPIYLY